MDAYGFILAPLLGWFFAQGVKFIFTLRRDGLQLKDLYTSGGFPSSHTASTVALASVIGFSEGFETSIFAVAALLAGIVMYDAIGVRRSTGEHTLLLKKLIKNQKQYENDNKELHVFLGHSAGEVMGGLFLGVLIGYICSQIIIA